MKNISYVRGQTFKVSFQAAAFSRRGIQANAAQGGLVFLVLFCLYDFPTPSHDVELALYADDMAIVATSREAALVVSFTSTT